MAERAFRRARTLFPARLPWGSFVVLLWAWVAVSPAFCQIPQSSGPVPSAGPSWNQPVGYNAPPQPNQLASRPGAQAPSRGLAPRGLAPGPARRIAGPPGPVPPLTFPTVRETVTFPPSPAQHFAEMADAELSDPASDVQLAVYQSPSGGGSNEPTPQDDNLGERPPGSVQREKNEPRSQQGGTGRRPPGTIQREKNEPRGKSASGDGFEHLVFGRIQADTVTFGQSPNNIKQVGHAPNGTDFRRARIGVQGTGYDVYFYRFEVDFSNLDQVVAQVPRITDAYAEIRQLGYVGTLRGGEFRVPFSTERLMSANDLTFIERGLPQAFNPARQLGLMLFNSTPNYLASYYSAIQTFQATDQGEQFGKAGRFDFTQRFVFLPWYDEPSNGRYLFHVGAAYQYQNARNNTVKYSTTPEAVLTYFTTKNLIPNFITTPSIFARDVQIAQVEASAVIGSLSFQAEYYGTWVDPTASGTPFFFHGAYVYGSYFLTGEHRPYSRDQGYYTQVTPFTNFFRVKDRDGNMLQGWGAWELAARFSTMNLSDKSIQGGRLNDVTLGVNWYLTRQMKVMANYIYAMNNVNNKATYANVFETRCQVVW